MEGRGWKRWELGRGGVGRIDGLPGERWLAGRGLCEGGEGGINSFMWSRQYERRAQFIECDAAYVRLKHTHSLCFYYRKAKSEDLRECLLLSLM